MKINEPVPEEAMKAQAITLPPLCFRWACMFGIMSRSFFLQTLAFPSLWSIKSVHKTLSQNFWGSSPILLANEWFASSGVASVLLFMKSSANSRLWYLHSCPLEVVADVTNSCFRVFLYSCHNVSVVNCWCFPWSFDSFWSFLIPWFPTKHTCQSHVSILLVTWAMGEFKQKVLSSKLFIRSRYEYLEIKAEMLISHLIFIFWCQTQMFSVYSKNKGIGLTVPILLEGSVYIYIYIYIYTVYI